MDPAVSIAARELNTFVVNQAHVWDAQNAVVEEQRREAVGEYNQSDAQFNAALIEP